MSITPNDGVRSCLGLCMDLCSKCKVRFLSYSFSVSFSFLEKDSFLSSIYSHGFPRWRQWTPMDRTPMNRRTWWATVHRITESDMSEISMGFSVHGILQARILEWVAMSSSRGSSQHREQTCVSCISYIGKCVLYH